MNVKKLQFSIISSMMISAVYGACPSGYVTVDMPNVVVVTGNSCPTGYVSVGTTATCATSGVGECFDVCPNLPANAHWTNANTCTYACNDGYSLTVMNTCAQMCTAGVTRISTSTGVLVPLYNTRQTTPALNVSVDGKTCYGNLATGTATNAINVQYDGKSYHTIN